MVTQTGGEAVGELNGGEAIGEHCGDEGVEADDGDEGLEANDSDEGLAEVADGAVVAGVADSKAADVSLGKTVRRSVRRQHLQRLRCPQFRAWHDEQELREDACEDACAR